jgi:tRNA(fMet)-specific endonuclease VapC
VGSRAVICVDSTYCIDVANQVPGAAEKAAEMARRNERLAMAAPALTEFLVGAFARGGRRLAQALEMVEQFEILPVTEEVALDAARLGGECTRRGAMVGNLDLLIAACARQHGARILTRDPDFGRIPNVLLETY